MELEPISESTHEQIDLIDSLLQSATIPPENVEYWQKRLSILTYYECENLIEYLLTKQVNRVLAGLNYNMTYLKNHMKKTI